MASNEYDPAAKGPPDAESATFPPARETVSVDVAVPAHVPFTKNEYVTVPVGVTIPSPVTVEVS